MRSVRPSTDSVVLTVLLILVVIASGCVGPFGPGDSGSDERAMEIRDRALAKMDDASTYGATMHMTVDADEGTLESTVTGAVNETSRRMRFDVSIEGPDGGTRETKAYIENETRYRRMGATWTSEDVSQRDIWRNDRLQRQRRLLQGSSVSFEGNETVHGIATYVVASDPNESTVERVLADSPSGSAAMEDVNLKEFSLTYYIAHETYRLRKVRMGMRISRDGQTADVTMALTFRRYGEPIEIDLPDAIDGAGGAPPTPVS